MTARHQFMNRSGMGMVRISTPSYPVVIWDDIRRHLAGEHVPEVVSAFAARRGYKQQQWTPELLMQLVNLRAQSISGPKIQSMMGITNGVLKAAVKTYALPPSPMPERSPNSILYPITSDQKEAKYADHRKPTIETERRVKLATKMRRCLTCVSNDVANPWFKSAHAGVRMCSDHRNMSVGMD